MNRRDKKVELLLPASSLPVLKTAVRYGADAVYMGGNFYGLRAKAENFTHDEMAEGPRRKISPMTRWPRALLLLIDVGSRSM